MHVSHTTAVTEVRVSMTGAEAAKTADALDYLIEQFELQDEGNVASQLVKRLAWLLGAYAGDI
jgi:hypothetical protein